MKIHKVLNKGCQPFKRTFILHHALKGLATLKEKGLATLMETLFLTKLSLCSLLPV